jgi:hypothetical protein
MFLKIDGCGKFVAVSDCKVAVKGPNRRKYDSRKLIYKSLVKLIKKNMTAALPDVHCRGNYS